MIPLTMNKMTVVTTAAMVLPWFVRNPGAQAIREVSMADVASEMRPIVVCAREPRATRAAEVQRGRAAAIATARVTAKVLVLVLVLGGVVVVMVAMELERNVFVETTAWMTRG